MDKYLWKEIYEFAKIEKLKSFHSVGFGYLPKITLIDLIEKNTNPVNYIVVNSLYESYLNDKKILEEKFNLPVVIEYHNPEHFFALV
jgi:hypothetical protein